MDKLWLIGKLGLAAFIFIMGIILFLARDEDLQSGTMSNTILAIILCVVAVYYAKYVLG